MKKESLTVMIGLIICFIILSVGIAGCTSQAPAAPAAPGTSQSTIEPSAMILQTSEIPVNFTLMEKAARNVSEMNAWALDHGWKKGYYAVYQKNDPNSPSGTAIEQTISVYPAENITLIVPDTIQGWKNWSVEENNVNLSIENLPLPTIGDSSAALKVTDKSDSTQMYVIAFVKKNVYQQFLTNGTAADYETTRQLAGIAAAKIQ